MVLILQPDIWVINYFLLSFSSVGLAKAALEAINGFNLFGNQVKQQQ